MRNPVVNPTRRTAAALVCAAAAVLATPRFAHAAGPDMRFDVCTFNATPEGSADHMNQTLFNDLNFTTLSGHTIAMGSDTHRPELDTAGNTLGAYYNTLTTLYTNQSTKDGNAAADSINSYVTSGFQKVGSRTRPNWVVLNELSSSLWQNTTATGDTYRQWVVDCATKLHDTYGYEIITYSPFPTPGARDATWQALSAKSYIGIENYLSGEEVKAASFDYNWVKAQYQASITAYGNRGVPKSRLILGEEFAYTTSGTGWGRAGVSTADWEATIRVRSRAIYDLGFAGFIGFAWSKNAMALSDAEMLYAEDVYRSTMVVQSESPHWLAAGGGSWGVRNNWLAYSTVPSAAGDVARFDKTITFAAATVTLDGDRTVGQLIFNTVHPLTLAPGTGGTLTLNNVAAAPVINVMAGEHKVTAPLAFAAPATLSIASGASLDITGNDLTLAGPVPPIRQHLFAHQLLSSSADTLHRLGYLTTGPGTLVKLVYTGDTNFDGLVNGADYAALNDGYLHGGTTWSQGDFNYDGVVNEADYVLFNQTLAALPEPVSLAAGGVSLVMLLRNRPRK